MSVTIIIPTTNERQHFHKAIFNCYVNQTYRNKQLIVFEDGVNSTPSQFWIDMSSQRNDITYIHDNSRRDSIGLKRNIMIEHATTDYIAHFDDDDIYLPTYIEFMISHMTPDTALCKLSGWLNYTYNYSSIEGRRQKLLLPESSQKNGTVGAFYYRQLVPKYFTMLEFGFSYVYRRDVCKHIKFRNVSFNEDTPWALAVQKQYNVNIVQLGINPQVIHIQHDINTSKAHPNIQIPARMIDYVKRLRIHGINKLSIDTPTN